MGVAGQLFDLRRDSLAALDRDHDELDAEAEAFLADRDDDWLDDDDAWLDEGVVLDEDVVGAPVGTAGMRVACGWFPAEEFGAAIAAWPELVESWGAQDHPGYCRMLEARLKAFAVHGMNPQLAALSIAALAAYAERTGEDPGSPEARAGLAADLVGQGEASAWPPGRNQPCWCGSGRKYKKCCGPALALE